MGHAMSALLAGGAAPTAPAAPADGALPMADSSAGSAVASAAMAVFASASASSAAAAAATSAPLTPAPAPVALTDPRRRALLRLLAAARRRSRLRRPGVPNAELREAERAARQRKAHLDGLAAARALRRAEALAPLLRDSWSLCQPLGADSVTCEEYHNDEDNVCLQCNAPQAKHTGGVWSSGAHKCPTDGKPGSFLKNSTFKSGAFAAAFKAAKAAQPEVFELTSDIVDAEAYDEAAATQLVAGEAQHYVDVDLAASGPAAAAWAEADAAAERDDAPSAVDGAGLVTLLTARFFGASFAAFAAALRESHAVIAGGIVAGALGGAVDEASDVDIWCRVGPAADAVLAFFRERPARFSEQILRLGVLPGSGVDVASEIERRESAKGAAYARKLTRRFVAAQGGANTVASVLLAPALAERKAETETNTSDWPGACEHDQADNEYFGRFSPRGRMAQWVLGIHNFTLRDDAPQEDQIVAPGAAAAAAAAATAAAKEALERADTDDNESPSSKRYVKLPASASLLEELKVRIFMHGLVATALDSGGVLASAGVVVPSRIAAYRVLPGEPQGPAAVARGAGDKDAASDKDADKDADEDEDKDEDEDEDEDEGKGKKFVGVKGRPAYAVLKLGAALATAARDGSTIELAFDRVPSGFAMLLGSEHTKPAESASSLMPRFHGSDAGLPKFSVQAYKVLKQVHPEIGIKVSPPRPCSAATAIRAT
jgi:hypothetical protein